VISDCHESGCFFSEVFFLKLDANFCIASFCRCCCLTFVLAVAVDDDESLSFAVSRLMLSLLLILLDEAILVTTMLRFEN